MKDTQIVKWVYSGNPGRKKKNPENPRKVVLRVLRNIGKVRLG